MRPTVLNSVGDDSGKAATMPPPSTRKKGSVGVRAWLLIDASGQAQVVEAGKHAIMRRTGLPARDLRILDPLLSYPSTILGREQAIVINLEHIKAIITAHEVLLLNSKDPAVVPFVEELQRRLPCSYDETTQQVGQGDDMVNVKPSQSYAEFQGFVYDYQDSQFSSHYEEVSYKNDRSNDPSILDFNEYRNGQKGLPFEFRALEACLEAACSCLETETSALEEEAYPALDELTSKISTLNLERVRQIKSRLVTISGRVQKVRDELEHLLDDDEDMAEMYLTEKLFQQGMDGMSLSSNNDRKNGPGIDTELIQGDADYKSASQGTIKGFANDTTIVPSRNKFSSTSSNSLMDTKSLDVEELEMLLEAYFVQIDGTLNKLSALREYVDDTEDYINIMLDDKQNHLLQMGVMLTTATLVLSAFVVVVGVFGMNIGIELFDKDHAGMPEFLWTVGGCTTGSLFLYVVAIAWCKHRRLLE